MDVDDVCNGAIWLVNHGIVDGNRLCIDGESFGGFTALNALSRKVFQAGCVRNAIADLELLRESQHKFDSRYVD